MVLYNYVAENIIPKMGESGQKALKEWVNQTTDDEFSPLHFATYHGNYNIIKFIMENCDVDIYKKNKFGSSVLHIAA